MGRVLHPYTMSKSGMDPDTRHPGCDARLSPLHGLSWQIIWFLQRDHRLSSRCPGPASAMPRVRSAAKSGEPMAQRLVHYLGAHPVLSSPGSTSRSFSHHCTFSPPQMTLSPRGSAGLPPLSSRKRRLKPAGESAPVCSCRASTPQNPDCRRRILRPRFSRRPPFRMERACETAHLTWRQET